MKPPRAAAADIARQESMTVPGLAARVAAAAVLRDVIANGHMLDELFAAGPGLSRVAGLDPRDVALTRSIVTAALRRLGTIRHALADLLERGLPRTAAQIEWCLTAAAAQILFLDVPDHAAVDLAVRMTRLDAKTAPYAALINGVLRNLARRRDEYLRDTATLDQDTPPWLAARWRKTYGEADSRAIAAAHRLEPTLDITVKSDPDLWAERLGATVLPTGSLRLSSHVPIPELPGYAEGAWWVQDAAAALPAQLIAVDPNVKIADLCSAPGGKAAQLAARGARVTAIDRSAERLKILSSNFERLRLEAEIVVADVVTLNGTLNGSNFDAVLLDAPCSATGTIRRHPDVAWTKKPGDLTKLAAMQSRMLDKAFELVRPGGTIVYCTCSIEPEEGEQQIAALLRRNPDIVRFPVTPAEVGGLAELINANGEVRTLPSFLPADDPRLAGLDGFFIARLTRHERRGR
ncbi:RsmB/NOP family class I SAM-dependent RNA methyltransferase [Methylovirgula sp. HY1]|uniref:RsmB/NOP family class I SAM-dependent RNA methyltransferase n=1 Tax=Methylovirgula sp. HY1 TaxID=2822761 RepID=UPI001C5AF49E|nr:Ribosomal RNA small subunit methyltransferase B [Methylovirgula sp. HY1]